MLGMTGAEIKTSVATARAAGRFVLYLRGLRRERRRTQEILRGALAVALCPEDTPATAVVEQANRMVEWLWEPQPARGVRGRLTRARIAISGRVRGTKRRLQPRLSEWPYWREELQDEFRKTISNADLRDLRNTCPEAPRNVAEFLDELPDEVLRQLQQRRGMDQFAVDLLASLQRADEIRSRFAPSRSTRIAMRVVPVMSAAAAGGVASVADASTVEALGVGGAGLAVGTAAMTVASQRRGRAAQRRLQANASVLTWTEDVRRALGRPDNEKRATELAALREDLTARLITRVRATRQEDLLDALMDIEELLVSDALAHVGNEELSVAVAIVEARIARDGATEKGG